MQWTAIAANKNSYLTILCFLVEATKLVRLSESRSRRRRLRLRPKLPKIERRDREGKRKKQTFAISAKEQKGPMKAIVIAMTLNLNAALKDSLSASTALSLLTS
jgi:hypothetical protein